MPEVFTATNFPVDTVTFGKIKPNGNGGFNVELSVGPPNDEILLQTPRMRAPFGLSTNKNNPYKKEIDLSFQGIENNVSMKNLRKCVEDFDNKVIEYALKNSKQFFNKDLSREVIQEYYCSNIKVSKKEQYSDTLKFKCPFLKPNPEKNNPDGKFITTFWTSKGEEKDFSYIERGDNLTCLAKPQMLWVINKQFGVTWVVTSVKVNKQVKTSGFVFKKTEEDISDNEETEEEEEDVETEEVVEVEDDEAE